MGYSERLDISFSEMKDSYDHQDKIMRKTILPLAILWVLTCSGQGFSASMNFYYNPNGLATVTGTIEGSGLNSIDVYDEERKRVERFIYLEGNERFHKGDYVRIYYHPKGGIVQKIKKMTVLEYKENGQNLGNILHH